jgi:hypothetical protein
MNGRFSVRSDSFQRQNVQRLPGLFCKRELYACHCFSRLSKFECSDFASRDEHGEPAYMRNNGMT